MPTKKKGKDGCMTAVISANKYYIFCHFVALLEGACAQDDIQVILATAGV